VTYTVNIGQARFVPQVCYKMSSDLRATVEEMVEKGLARIYSEEVRFISGAPVPTAKPPRVVSYSAPAPERSPAVVKAGRGSGRRGGRS